MLLILSLCLYSGAVLVTCLIFLVRTTHLPFSMDKAIAYLLGCGTHEGSCGEGGDSGGGGSRGGRGAEVVVGGVFREAALEDQCGTG